LSIAQVGYAGSGTPSRIILGPEAAEDVAPTLIESKIARAPAPDPDRPSSKNVTASRCGRETEKISTPLNKPPCPVTDDRQIRTPYRNRQRT